MDNKTVIVDEKIKKIIRNLLDLSESNEYEKIEVTAKVLNPFWINDFMGANLKNGDIVIFKIANYNELYYDLDGCFEFCVGGVDYDIIYLDEDFEFINIKVKEE